jgi:hypothetical protein
VGDLCGRLLRDLSGGAAGRRFWGIDLPADPVEARKWFESAKKVGEEKWLLDHAWDKDERPDRSIAQVIGAKYPARLSAIHREAAKKGRAGYLFYAVKTSRLPDEQKVALVEEDLQNISLSRRDWHLRALAELDPARFRVHLLQTLKQLRTERPAQRGWFLNAEEYFPRWLPELVASANDAACWAALSAIAKAVSPGDRFTILAALWPPRPPDTPDPARAARLRFALQFLNDRSSDPKLAELWELGASAEVRDYAASFLAYAFRIGLEKNTWFAPVHDKTLGALSRLILRVQVRHLAVRELGGER